MLSHPMRVRGLKRCYHSSLAYSLMSHPMRVRGLKHLRIQQIILLFSVAPHAGAWIETRELLPWQKKQMSHPMRVRGLKH